MPLLIKPILKIQGLRHLFSFGGTAWDMHNKKKLPSAFLFCFFLHCTELVPNRDVWTEVRTKPWLLCTVPPLQHIIASKITLELNGGCPLFGWKLQLTFIKRFKPWTKPTAPRWILPIKHLIWRQIFFFKTAKKKKKKRFQW